MGRNWAGWVLATDSFRRLSHFAAALRQRAAPVWKTAVPHFERWLQWLWRRQRLVVLVIVGCMLLYLGWSHGPQVWAAYRSDRESFIPFFTPFGALLVGVAAFGQWRTARLRHEEQTRADLQSRIIESFTKAVDQLGSDKLEVRLGGIYSLERISKESPGDYWMVMENLTAFVRERSRRNEDERAEAVKREKISAPSTIDIAAVLTVISRQTEESRETERVKGWHLDLRGAFLRPDFLVGVQNFEGAYLHGAHLEKAYLASAHLEGAWLDNANLEEADLSLASLKLTVLVRAILKKANLRYANLCDAWCSGADFEGADLTGADLTRADLKEAVNLSEVQLLTARGNAETTLPDGMDRPKQWLVGDPG